MGFIEFTTVVVGRAAAHLLELLSVLIVLRGARRLSSNRLINEFDEAGKPLINRTLQATEGVWNALLPGRPIFGIRHLIVAWLLVGVCRVGLLAILGLARLVRDLPSEL